MRHGKTILKMITGEVFGKSRKEILMLCITIYPDCPQQLHFGLNIMIKKPKPKPIFELSFSNTFPNSIFFAAPRNS